MKCLEITTYAKTPMKSCVLKFSLLVRWNETFIIGENRTKCWFSVNTSDKFTVFTNAVRHDFHAIRRSNFSIIYWN